MGPIAYNIDFMTPLEGLQRGQAVGDSFVKADLQNKGLGLANTQVELTNEALGINNISLAERNQAALDATRAGTQSTIVDTKSRKIENITAGETDILENERRRLENEALRRANEAEVIEEEENARITELYQKIADGTATPQDYQILAALLPEEQSKAVRESLAIMTAQEQEKEVAELAPIFSAFHSGSPAVAIGLLKKQAEAYRNAGDTQSADIFDSMVDVAESGPDGHTAVEAYIGYMMTELEGGTKIMEGAKTYWEIEKLQAEIDKLRNPTGDLTVEDVFKMEKMLRDEYTRGTEALKMAKLDYDKAIASGQKGTGAGDVALVFSFMRILDPGSVVRESEFAQARDTTGLIDSLLVQYNKLLAGESLSPTQRTHFINLIKDYMQAAENDAERAREDLQIVIDNYGFNADNVFGVVGKDETTSIGGINHLRSFIIRNNPEDNPATIEGMSEAQIAAQYKNGYAAFRLENPRSTPPPADNGEEVIELNW